MSRSSEFNDVSNAIPKKRPAPYSIRFTDKERAILTREAMGRSWADYIRDRVFGGAFTPRQRGRKDQQHLAEVGRMLAGLGHSRLAQNMNQISKAAHLGTLPMSPAVEMDIRDACQDIRRMRQELVAALGVKPQE